MNLMSQSISGSVDSKSFLWPATLAVSNSTRSLGVSQGLWGQRAGLVSQYGSMWGAGNQQVRNVMVEVTNDDLERAIRKMKRRLKDDNGIKLLRERQYFRKPSELKVLARKERDKRVAKKAFRAKLKWITARQARGF
jgi:ribosomal protein S21